MFSVAVLKFNTSTRIYFQPTLPSPLSKRVSLFLEQPRTRTIPFALHCGSYSLCHTSVSITLYSQIRERATQAEVQRDGLNSSTSGCFTGTLTSYPTVGPRSTGGHFGNSTLWKNFWRLSLLIWELLLEQTVAEASRRS